MIKEFIAHVKQNVDA